MFVFPLKFIILIVAHIIGVPPTRTVFYVRLFRERATRCARSRRVPAVAIDVTAAVDKNDFVIYSFKLVVHELSIIIAIDRRGQCTGIIFINIMIVYRAIQSDRGRVERYYRAVFRNFGEPRHNLPIFDSGEGFVSVQKFCTPVVQ